jgi:molybdopterin-synthase adenylyltransferase
VLGDAESVHARTRLKPIYPRYREPGDRFRIGAQHEMTLELTDPKGEAWDLLDLLDGERDVGQVIEEMQRRHPNLTREEVGAALDRFDGARLLEDSNPSVFDSDRQYSRYLGNVNYFSHFARADDRRGEKQEKLCSSTVALLGLGGGGSTILTLLSGLGVGTVRAVDRDVVEMTNLNRQLLFAESDIGRPKTEAAARWTRSRGSLQRFEFFDLSIESPDDIGEIVEGCDLVISAVDDPPGIIQRLVNKVCVEATIPCVYGVSQVTRGRVFSVIPRRSGCIDCLFLHYNEMDKNWAQRFRTADWRRPSHATLAFGPNIMRLAAEVTDEAVRILTGYLPSRSVGAQLELNFETGVSYELLRWERTDACPTCGSGNEEEVAALLGSRPLRAGAGGAG